jgi:hypothetical protein
MNTLFCEAPGKMGFLVEQGKDGRNKRKVMRFKDGHAALAWCEANRVCLIYMPPEPPPVQN